MSAGSVRNAYAEFAFLQIDLTPVKELWQTSKKDFFSWVGSFIICLVAGVELGLLFGIVVSMICILLRLGNPKVEISLKKVSRRA